MILSFDAAAIFQLIFYVAALCFILHALISAYHWLTFGAERKVSLISLAAYLLSGAIILILMAITLNFM